MAIYSLHHSALGKTTHAPGTAGAHITYVTRRRAASGILSARLPVAKPGAATETRAWFDAHEAKSRKNARIADKIMIALPIELDAEQCEALVADFAEALTDRRAPWIAAIHASGKDSTNPHAHVVVVDRDPTTGKRAVGLSEKGSTDRLRLLWEQHTNRALASAGVAARIDRRSLAAQGVERVAEIHVGPKSLAIEQKGVRPESRDRIDDKGRAIRWASEIDDNRTRSERRAEIIAANAAAVQDRHFADMAALWESCARQLAADKAEREEAALRQDVAAARDKIADSRLRLDALGIRLAAAFSRERERLAEARQTIATVAKRLAAAFKMRTERHRAAERDVFAPPPRPSPPFLSKEFGASGGVARQAPLGADIAAPKAGQSSDPPARAPGLDIEALRQQLTASIDITRQRAEKLREQQRITRRRDRGRTPGED